MTPFASHYAVVPEERPVVEQVLRRMVDDDRCSLAVTTGGTGPAARDVTPEATRAVCERELPGSLRLSRRYRVCFIARSRATC